MTNVVIVDAVRTPVGRRGGGLSSVHPADLLATVQSELVARTGIDPAEIGQVVGGCVSQVGEQSFNLARTAWLAAGLPFPVPATTVDTQCGSSQQATNLATSLVGSGVVDVAVACGVEVMSRMPIGSSSRKDLGLGIPIPKTYFGQYEFTSQFEGAERIADKWGITRDDADAFGLASQQRAAPGLGRGSLRRQHRRRRRARPRRGRQAGRHHPPGGPGRGPAGDDARGAGQAQAGRPPGRRAHRRLLLADLRRRGRRAAR